MADQRREAGSSSNDKSPKRDPASLFNIVKTGLAADSDTKAEAPAPVAADFWDEAIANYPLADESLPWHLQTSSWERELPLHPPGDRNASTQPLSEDETSYNIAGFVQHAQEENIAENSFNEHPSTLADAITTEDNRDDVPLTIDQVRNFNNIEDLAGAYQNEAKFAANSTADRVASIDDQLQAKDKLADKNRNMARGFELYKIHSVEHELAEGDTLVFLDFPKSPKDSRHLVDCAGIGYRDQKFRVNSKKLLDTGSSKFADMFAPTYQFRVQRRRKVVNKLPEGVKYVLDLTPPSEGDDLVFQMMELSLTPGIMRWWTSPYFLSTNRNLVAGHDDICACRIPKRRSVTEQNKSFTQEPPKTAASSSSTALQPPQDQWAAIVEAPSSVPNSPAYTPTSLLQMKARGENESVEVPEFRKIPDYCPFRHCNSIIRLLMAIEGKDVHLDSAIRVWTLVAIAKIYDCTSVLKEIVNMWLMDDLNTRFIEVHPEEALRIGYALELTHVTKAAFRILVNEMALEEAESDPAKTPSPKVTVFGRTKGDLDDELNNLVQHAARTYVDRVAVELATLQSTQLFDYWSIAEFQRLRHIERLLLQRQRSSDDFGYNSALSKLRQLMAALPLAVSSMVTDAIEGVSAGSPSSVGPMDWDRARYTEARNFEVLTVITAAMNPVQIWLTAKPYMVLSSPMETHLYKHANSKSKDTFGMFYSFLVSQAMTALDSLINRDKHLILDYPEWEALVDPDSLKVPSGRIHVKAILNLDSLDEQVKETFRPIQLGWLRHSVDEPPMNLSRHLLLNLGPEEIKFLPLWADGLNDGTGGVFEEPLPPTEMGPNGPGPSYHTGMTIPSAEGSISSSFMDEIRDLNVRGSTTAGSIDVHDSISTVYNPNRVIADSNSIASESFADGNDSVYNHARYAQPAGHQGIGKALREVVERPGGTRSVMGDSGATETTDDLESVTTEKIFGGDGESMEVDMQGVEAMDDDDDDDDDANDIDDDTDSIGGGGFTDDEDDFVMLE